MPDLDAIAGERVDAVLPRQELLGLPDLPASAAEARGRVARRAGRPPGSPNRRIEQAAALAVERFGDPLLRQVAIATMDTEELALRLGCTAMEAVVEQRLAASVVLPYLHSRKPLQVDLSNHKVVHLTISDGPTAAAQDLAHMVGEVVEYQQVIEGEASDV